MKRSIIKIDEEKCTGCGLCIPNCPEGALQIIDGKARLVSDLMCDEDKMKVPAHTSCPGSQSVAFEKADTPAAALEGSRPSQLTHWPVQMHLISPNAPQYQGADLLLAADCIAFSLGDFHKDYLKGRALAIACPKLDEGQEIYLEKLKALIETAKINTLTVMIMQVPCCGGLLNLAKKAVEEAERNIPVKIIVVGIHGEILKEEWV